MFLLGRLELLKSIYRRACAVRAGLSAPLVLSKEPTSLQLESSSLSVSSSLLTATTRSLSFYPDISLYLSLDLSQMSGAYLHEVRRSGERRVQQRLQRRADDQRLQIPDQSGRLGGTERLPVLGQDRSMRLRFQQDRGQSEQLHQRAAKRGPDRCLPDPEWPLSYWAERSFHADVRGRRVLPAGLRAKVGQPRGSPSGLRRQGFLSLAPGLPALLDHKELVGEAMGRGRVLPSLQRTRHVRSQHHGFCRDRHRR